MEFVTRSATFLIPNFPWQSDANLKMGLKTNWSTGFAAANVYDFSDDCKIFSVLVLKICSLTETTSNSRDLRMSALQSHSLWATLYLDVWNVTRGSLNGDVNHDKPSRRHVGAEYYSSFSSICLYSLIFLFHMYVLTNLSLPYVCTH